VIATLLGVFASRPWARTVLRYSAVSLAILLFLLALRSSGERAGLVAT